MLRRIEPIVVLATLTVSWSHSNVIDSCIESHCPMKNTDLFLVPYENEVHIKHCVLSHTGQFTHR